MPQTKVTGGELSGTIPVNRQNNNTNAGAIDGSRIETGWGIIYPNGLASGAENVSFQQAFTDRPIVLVTSGGDHASSDTYGDGGVNIRQQFTYGVSVTTTGFVVVARSADGAAWPAGARVFYQWMAVGK